MRHSPKGEPSIEAVAQQANSQENDSLLLFSRLRHPGVRKQVIDMLMLAEIDHEKDGHELAETDEENNLLFDEQGKLILTHIDYKARSREEVEKDFENRLVTVETNTPLQYGGDAHLGSREVIPIGWQIEGVKLNDKQMSAVEAHEKGHYLRTYYGDTIDAVFERCFDHDVLLSETETDWARRTYPDAPEEDVRNLCLRPIFRPIEATERMAQLKNYFGMRRGERFTPTHLAYSRDHYVKDTGNDNGMTIFFRAITKKTEKEFLKVINSAGI